MSPETPLRLALLAIFGLTIGVVAYRRLRARTGEPISRRDEGLGLAIVLRLAGLVLWLATLAYLVDPAWMAWAQIELPPAVRWLGAALGAVCVALMYWTLACLGKNLTDTVAIRRQATLVTGGPYRWVRHPFYVTTGLLMLGATLLSANLFIGAASVVVLGLLAARTPKEEQKLLEQFGEPYRHYRATTGAFFPKWPDARGEPPVQPPALPGDEW